MKSSTKFFCAILFFLPLFLPRPACSLTICDGTSHNINSRLQETLSIRYEPVFHCPTVVTFEDPAFVPRTLVHDDCSLRIIGGTIAEDVVCLDDSKILISGGSMNRLLAFDKSTIEITGGLFRATDFSIYLGADTHDHAGTITISGGTFRGLIGMTNYDGNMIISGGEFQKSVHIHDGTHALIRGGLFLGKELHIADSACVMICGSDFKVNGVPIPHNVIYNGEGEGTLTGTLADGTAIDITLRKSQNSSLIFAGLPEPATLLILALGGLMLRRRN